MTSLDDLLQQHLERVEAGESLEEVLKTVPADQAEELESLLTLAVAINRIPHPEPNRMRMATELEKLTNRPRGLFDNIQRLLTGALRSVYVVGFTILIVGIFIAAVLLGPDNPLRIAEDSTPTGSPTQEEPSTAAPPVPTGAGSTLVAATPTPTVIETTLPPADEPIFAIYGSEPVILHGAPGRFDSLYTDPGAVIWHDGYFHMFRNGSREYPGEIGVAYLKSKDGVEWKEESDDPVLMGKDVPYAGFTIYVTDALVTVDEATGEETWSLYFSTVEHATEVSYVSGVIGRATAPSPLGPWEPDPEPIIVTGPSDAWDSYRVSSPSVVQTDDGLLMYYSGVSGAREERIGLATSVDGSIWEKYDDPGTTADRYAFSDPVFDRGFTGFWDGVGVFQPHVEKTDDGYVMLYAAREPFDGSTPPGLLGYGLAVSSDGIDWDRLDMDDPALTAEDVPRGQALFEAAFLYHEGEYFVYVEASTGVFSGTNIWAGLRDETLMP